MSVVSRAKNMLRRAASGDVAAYWTEHNVTRHHEFSSVEESLEYFHWRNDQYAGYIERMPVSGLDGRVVLEYGCGPGHDVVGIGHFSSPARLIAMDVSSTSLAEAQARVALHGIDAEFVQIPEENARLPLEDSSVDYIHSSGVLHHCSNMQHVLGELRRVMKPDGEMRVMVYHYDSIFLHLHVAYLTQIKQGRYADESVRDAFRHMTDGEHCPVSRAFRTTEFIEEARQAGLVAESIGCALAVFELSILPQRFDAITNRRTPREHREFLLSLRFDDAGYPHVNGLHAGVDACYSLRRA